MIFIFQYQRGIMIKLRPYQLEAIKCIKEKFDSGKKKQYVEMPTGSGKTITFLSYASKNHKQILIVVPSRELMKQVYETCLLFYHKSQISRKGDGHSDLIRQVHICIIASIRGEYVTDITFLDWDLVIIDEAHHIHANSYKRLIQSIDEYSKSCILGVTATPDRSDGKLLVQLLEDCTYSIDVETLIEKNFLCDIEGYVIKTNIDISDVDDHNGDFSLHQLYKKLSTDDRNNMIVDLCKNEMKERKNLIFCINIEHSKEVNELLNLNGISSAHIDGKCDSNKRKIILDSFRNGDISCLCNCQLLTEGFDEPSIDGIILARPTRSRALFTQMLGRGLRILKGKENCKIIDIVDNHRYLASFTNILSDKMMPEIFSFKS